MIPGYDYDDYEAREMESLRRLRKEELSWDNADEEYDDCEDQIMSKRCEMCSEAQKQRSKALARIHIFEQNEECKNNKLIMYILHVIKCDLKGDTVDEDS